MSDPLNHPAGTKPATAPGGGYRITPDDTAGIPSGIPYIIGNEAAERFSFYGMRAILYVFMTEYLLRSDGSTAALDETTANIWYHNFVTAAYFFPVVGALLSDWVLGKYRTIMLLSVVYCVGHAAMAMVDFPDQTGISPKTMLVAALTLIAVGTGGIKPCVSAHVGDQFGPRNKGLMPRVFTWFYFSINLGSAISTLLTPKLLEWYGPGVAFGVPGVLMFIATVLFWSGRNRFVHVPPTGNRVFSEIVSRDGLRAIANLTPLFILIAVFWSLFDQTSSTWVEQAKHMDRNVFGLELNPSQNQATNPILILLLIPVFGLVIYPQLSKLVTLTPLRKIGIGLFLTVPSFIIPAYVQRWIDAGETPHIGWQILAYLVITAAEIMVSITALEFSYTQAPRTLKSFVMGLFLLSVALGNKFTAYVNEVIQSQRAKGVEILEGENYYWFFASAMLGTALLYVVWSQFYRGETFIQGEGD